MKNYHKLTILSLAFLFAVTPLLSYAKGKDIAKVKVEKEHKTEKVEKSSCMRAFGHLIAPGFIKTHGQVTLENCWLPFGIAKKLNGHATSTHPVATSTPDTTAPVVSNFQVTTGTTTANLSWQTNEKATSTLYWSTSTPLVTNASTTASISSNSFKKDHALSIVGLTASTTYYFRVQSTDMSGNTSLSTTTSALTK
jgi:hypothetical protein